MAVTFTFQDILAVLPRQRRTAGIKTYHDENLRSKDLPHTRKGRKLFLTDQSHQRIRFTLF